MSIVPTSIRLDPDLHHRLKAYARKKRWSLSTLIASVMEAWLEKEDSKK
jgi:predicted transcriptional regulator